MLSEQAMQTIESSLWFAGLPSELKSRLYAIARIRELEPGETLFTRGDKPCGLYAVLSGMVRISGLNEQGKEAILTFVEAPNWFGEVSLFDAQPRTHDAHAEGKVVLLHIPQAAIAGLLTEQPHYWQQFGQLLSHKLRLAFIALEDLALLPAPIRLKRRLVMIAENYGVSKAGSEHVVSVPQERLGQMLSISRQTTNQILKELAQQGLIRSSYGRIEILDLDALRQSCGLSDA